MYDLAEAPAVNAADSAYLALLSDILENGERREDRTAST